MDQFSCVLLHLSFVKLRWKWRFRIPFGSYLNVIFHCDIFIQSRFCTLSNLCAVFKYFPNTCGQILCEIWLSFLLMFEVLLLSKFRITLWKLPFTFEIRDGLRLSTESNKMRLAESEVELNHCQFKVRKQHWYKSKITFQININYRWRRKWNMQMHCYNVKWLAYQ